MKGGQYAHLIISHWYYSARFMGAGANHSPYSGRGASYITCYCSYSCNSLAGICDIPIIPTKDKVPRASPWISTSFIHSSLYVSLSPMTKSRIGTVLGKSSVLSSRLKSAKPSWVGAGFKPAPTYICDNYICDNFLTFFIPILWLLDTWIANISIDFS